MITGPAASGKTTLCQSLCEKIPAYFYKPSYAYFELAQLFNVPKEKMFSDIHEEDAINQLCFASAPLASHVSS